MDSFGRVALAALIALRPRVQVSRLQVDASSPVSGGGGIFHQVQVVTEDVARQITDQLSQSETFLDRISSRISTARKRSFMRSTISQQLYPWIVLALVAQRDHAVGSQPVVLTAASDLSPMFVDAMVPQAAGVRFINVRSWRDSSPVRLGWFVGIQAVRFFTALYRAPRQRAARRRAESRQQGVVAIQHVWGPDEDGPPTDLWWFVRSGIDPARCLVFFNTGKLSEEVVRDSVRWLRREGVPYCFLDATPYREPGDVVLSTNPGARQVLSDLLSLARMLLWAVRAPARSWQLSTWMRVLVPLRRWETFMKAERIKVFFDKTDTSMDAAVLAADLVGAIKIGMSSAVTVIPQAASVVAHQVQFVWGALNLELVQAQGAAAEVWLEAGKVDRAGNGRSRWRESAREMRARFRSAEVSHIVTVLDRSSGPDALCPRPYHVAFYEALVSWAERDPSLRLLVKPKGSLASLLEQNPGLAERIDRLEAGGRIMVLDPWRHPEEAALASHVVVALGPNSAGVQTATEGVPTVFWDPSGSIRGPYGGLLRRAGWTEGRVVFDSMDKLIEVAQEYFQDSRLESQQGEFSQAAAAFDSFQDGKTGDRIGSFVRWFLEGTDRGLDRAAAIRGVPPLFHHTQLF
ncbi:MAG: hypothetical protein IIC31_05560 [Chloroflexi bacterium]|nr:hypothetical protein [Chloroflexota bacterium]